MKKYRLPKEVFGIPKGTIIDPDESIKQFSEIVYVTTNTSDPCSRGNFVIGIPIRLIPLLPEFFEEVKPWPQEGDECFWVKYDLNLLWNPSNIRPPSVIAGPFRSNKNAMSVRDKLQTILKEMSDVEE